MQSIMSDRRPTNDGRIGDIAALVRVIETSTDDRDDSIARRREILVAFCKSLDQRKRRLIPTRPDAAAIPPPRLPRRMKQTLELLVDGASEKQIARRLALSQHTVHEYVKLLHRGFNVSSRS